MRATSLGLKPIQSVVSGDSPKVRETDAAVSGFASGARSAPASQVTSRPSTPPMERARPESDWPRISSQVLRASLVSTVSNPAAFSVSVPAYSQVLRGVATQTAAPGATWKGCSHHNRSGSAGGAPVASQCTSGFWSAMDATTSARLTVH